MNDGRRTAWRPLGVAVAIAVVVLLGDLRSPVSTAAPLDAPTVDRVTRPVATDPTVAPQRAALASIHDVPRGATAADPVDEARLVPAIYAWDPDVRFVYYRHVSKWM